MKRNIAIVFIAICFITCFARIGSGGSCGNYGGDSCSNMDHQEVGDAVYRTLLYGDYFPDPLEYDHVALYIGLSSSGVHKVIQAEKEYEGVYERDFSSINQPGAGESYWGAYNTGNLSVQDRLDIVAVASLLEADTDIEYEFNDALDYTGWTWEGTVDDINNIRCDGLIEYSYEKSGENVWGQYGSKYDISYSTDYCDAHNDMPDASVNADKELSPKAQRGGFGNTNTYMDPSTPRSPTTSYSITSGTLGSNGWYKSDVEVRIRASDDSGIYYIKRKFGVDGSYATIYSSSSTVTVSSSGTLYFYAKDNAGNYPYHFNSATINIDKAIPSVTITSPTSSSTYSTSSSSLNISGNASDNVGVTQVTWSNNRSGSGTCSGTTSWSKSGITLYSGQNVITVTARDAAGNTGTDTLTVTYTLTDTTPPDTSITGGPPSGTITYNDVTFTYTGSDDVTYTSNPIYSHKLDGYDSDWSSYTSSTLKSYNDLPNGSYTFYVKAKDEAGNFDSSPASGSFTVNYSTSCTYSISPDSQSFSSSGGTGSVSVIAPSGCDWTATSNDGWITITSDSVGSGDGSVNYSVSSYEGTSPRTGTMTIAGKTFTVTQSGPCIYSISPTSQSFSSSGGSGTVSVTTTESDCDWTAISNYDWITITSDSSGIGNGTVSYWVSNSSTSFRAGTMTIAGETFTVTQGDLVSPVYRFWSDTQQAHFYTIDEGEKEYVIATYPDNVWRYEGIAFYTFAEGNQPADAAAVHRFWSDTQHAHFYTIDEGEKEYVIATYPENVWRYEGIAFYAYPVR